MSRKLRKLYRRHGYILLALLAGVASYTGMYLHYAAHSWR